MNPRTNIMDFKKLITSSEQKTIVYFKNENIVSN